MTIELLLGWFILTMLGIGSIAASEPFWGPRRARDEAVVIRLDRGEEAPDEPDREASRRAA